MINIRVCTAKLLKEHYQIEEDVTETLFDDGILHEHEMQKVLIKNEYNNKVQPTGKIDLQYKIADKFCVSVRLVREIIY